MKLEIDIPSILYQEAKENRKYISLTKLEIAWKVIADGRPLEQEPTTKNDLGVNCISREQALQVGLEGDGYADGKLVYDYGKCPKCGWDFEEGDKDWEQPYCCHCGQKLEWFDNEVESEG